MIGCKQVLVHGHGVPTKHFFATKLGIFRLTTYLFFNIFFDIPTFIPTFLILKRVVE